MVSKWWHPHLVSCLVVDLTPFFQKWSLYRLCYIWNRMDILVKKPGVVVVLHIMNVIASCSSLKTLVKLNTLNALRIVDLFILLGSPFVINTNLAHWKIVLRRGARANRDDSGGGSLSLCLHASSQSNTSEYGSYAAISAIIELLISPKGLKLH